MRRFTIVGLFAALSAQAEIIDRIAVSFGDQVITESAILLDLRVSAFLDRAPVDLSPTAKRKSANRLVDQLLMIREASESRITLPGIEASAKLLDMVKRQFNGEAEFQAELKRYAITESDVSQQLLSGLIALQFSDLRFQTSAVSEEDARAYYDFLKLTTPFESTREEINTVIAQQRAFDALDDWLVSARESARVTFREKVFQ